MSRGVTGWSAGVVRRAASMAASLMLAGATTGTAAVVDFVGRPVVDVQIVSQGQTLRDTSMLALVETRLGAPLSMRDVRESLTHLFSLGRFQDVQLDAASSGGGVALRYELVPLRVASDVVFQGMLGLSRGDLRGILTERFDLPLRIEFAEPATEVLIDAYLDRGYLDPRITTRVEGQPSGAETLVFEIDAGPRPRLSRLDVTGVAPEEVPALLDRLALRSGARFDRVDLDQRLADYLQALREDRFYDAELYYRAEPAEDRQTVGLTVDVRRGPQVLVRFDGDPIPEDQQDELVPVESEGSVDEDLLEDSSRRIETFLRAQGYRDAVVTHARETAGETLSIVFSVTRGRVYRMGPIAVDGRTAVTESEVLASLALNPGDPFVVDTLDRGVAAVRELYRRLGYPRVQIQPEIIEPPESSTLDPVVVHCVLNIDEGPRAFVGAIRIEGNETLSDADLLAGSSLVAGLPYYAPQVGADREAMLIQYLNEGYERASVTVTPAFSADFQTVELDFAVTEGDQTIVDHILIAGNAQIDSATIRREVPLVEGDPLGADDVAYVRQRLSALGVFRRIEIREFSHGGGGRRDLVIVVDEAPATHLAYGGGLELSPRLRSEGGSGPASERLEFAPRGFFQIGRRNLGGTNRSVDLFSRVSVRRENDAQDDESFEPTLGFNEYRFLGTYREPRVFGMEYDALVSGFVEQAVRTSFDLYSRGVNAQLRRALSPTISGAVAYQIGQNRVSDFSDVDKPIVDRLFPEVVLSAFSANFIADTRDDPFEPTRGALIGLEGEVAGRLIGSEVGFAKTLVEGFLYRDLPGARPVVVAAGARLGLAVPFSRTVTYSVGSTPDIPGGSVTTEVRDLPVSERFFAGGDTTVRGFALDRLGDEATIDRNGFPTGGNAMLVLNGELRVPVWRDLGMVGFVDAGNVFSRVTDFSLRQIRGSAGLGIRYRSPMGPIRVDLGFKLDRRRFAGGERERLTALHISIGQAF